MLEIGQKILVPRTDGSTTPGQIKEIMEDGRVLVVFPLGETYRGREIPEEYRGRMGEKILSAKGLVCA